MSYTIETAPGTRIQVITDQTEIKIGDCVTAVPVSVRHPHRHGFYRPWPAHTTWETRVWQSDEGTLIIDLVDAERSQLVWTGTAQKTISDRTRESSEASVNNAVAAIFAEFPFTVDAGVVK